MTWRTNLVALLPAIAISSVASAMETTRGEVGVSFAVDFTKETNVCEIVSTPEFNFGSITTAGKYYLDAAIVLDCGTVETPVTVSFEEGNYAHGGSVIDEQGISLQLGVSDLSTENYDLKPFRVSDGAPQTYRVTVDSDNYYLVAGEPEYIGTSYFIGDLSGNVELDLRVILDVAGEIDEELISASMSIPVVLTTVDEE